MKLNIFKLQILKKTKIKTKSSGFSEALVWVWNREDPWASSPIIIKLKRNSSQQQTLTHSMEIWIFNGQKLINIWWKPFVVICAAALECWEWIQTAFSLYCRHFYTFFFVISWFILKIKVLQLKMEWQAGMSSSLAFWPNKEFIRFRLICQPVSPQLTFCKHEFE